jgi:hypothetical protein
VWFVGTQTTGKSFVLACVVGKFFFALPTKKVAEKIAKLYFVL